MADVYFEAAFGQTHPRRDDGSGSTDYTSQDFSVGVRLPVGLEGGTVLGEIGYNHTAGNEKTLGSHRHLPLVRIGYRQPFLTYLFASAKVGTGFNMSRINFGDGMNPLPHDTNIPFLASAELGGQYCFGRHPCLEAFASPFYETNLLGNPDYRNTGIMFGLGVSFDLGRTAPYDEYATAVRRQTELEGALAASQRRVHDLEDEERRAREGQPTPPVVASQPALSPLCPPGPELLPPPPDVLTILTENPLRLPFVFTNESPQLAVREERVHRVRVSLNDPWLDKVVEYLTTHPHTGIRIQGHANDTGPEDQNITISDQRARAVARYLIRHGVPPDQIVEVRGYGSASPPLRSNPGDSINRSVTFEEVPLP